MILYGSLELLKGTSESRNVFWLLALRPQTIIKDKVKSCGLVVWCVSSRWSVFCLLHLCFINAINNQIYNLNSWTIQYIWVQVSGIKLVHGNQRIQLLITLIWTLCEILEQISQGQLRLKNQYPQWGHQVLNISCKGNKIRKQLCFHLLHMIIPKVLGHNETKCWIRCSLFASAGLFLNSYV